MHIKYILHCIFQMLASRHSTFFLGDNPVYASDFNFFFFFSQNQPCHDDTMMIGGCPNSNGRKSSLYRLKSSDMDPLPAALDLKQSDCSELLCSGLRSFQAYAYIEILQPCTVMKVKYT